MAPAILSAALLAAAIVTPPPIRVVTSLTTYAAIAREIAGERGSVTAIAEGDENPHFVQPRPSFVPLLRDADLFVTTGLDLELWVPALLDRAGNVNVREGGRGFVAAYQGTTLLEIPASLSRAQGDIHVDGNPHIGTDPVNGILIARNIAAGLERVDPAGAVYYRQRLQDFELRVLRALIGEELVGILTPATAFDLLRTDRLLDFVQRTPYQGRPLAERLGGWMRQAAALRGREIACYHREFSYFNRRFGLSCLAYIEAKPGIPASPRHVQAVITLMRERRVPVLLAAVYFDRTLVREIAQRTGARAVVVTENAGGMPGTDTYLALVSSWVSALADAVAPAGEP
jgi:zinc/manganese transport system substrate-binding protein